MSGGLYGGEVFYSTGRHGRRYIGRRKVLLIPHLDDVGAFVFDIGSSSVRAGNAGDEYPKWEIPSVVGVVQDESETKEGGDASRVGQQRKIYLGTNKLCVPRENCEMRTFMKDSLISDWDLFEDMMDYVYTECMRADSEHHPALFSEAAWNDRPRREKLCELMFEKYKLPAFYLVKNAVLSTSVLLIYLE